MDKLNIYRNIFLGKEELEYFQKFLQDDTFSKMIVESSNRFGIISSSDNVDYLNIVANSNIYSNIIRILPGNIISNSKRFISVPNSFTYSVPPSSGATQQYYYFSLAPITVNYEMPAITIDSFGVVSGAGSIVDKLRGQGSDVPTCVRFVKINSQTGEASSVTPENNGIYEIVSIFKNEDGQSQIQLSSYYDFVAEGATGDLRMIILGSLPLSKEFSEDQKNGLYSYDRYVIDLEEAPSGNKDAYIKNIGGTDYYFFPTASGNTSGEPSIAADGNKFCLGIVGFVDNVLRIIDTRSWAYCDVNGNFKVDQYWAFQNLGGNAGGDLQGVYPNPTLKPGVVGTEELENGAVTREKLAEDIVAYDLVISKSEDFAKLATTTASSVAIMSGTYYPFSHIGEGESGMDIVLSPSINTLDGLGKVILIAGQGAGLTMYPMITSTNPDLVIRGIDIQFGYYFNDIQKLVDCKVLWDYTSGITNQKSGFENCSNLTNCVSNSGFKNCSNLTNCSGSSKILSGINTFDGCSKLLGCYGSGGFNTYNNCITVIGCVAMISADIDGNTNKGFNGCRKVQQCNVIGTSDESVAYINSFASFATGSTTYKCADTANGGFNNLDSIQTYLVKFFYTSDHQTADRTEYSNGVNNIVIYFRNVETGDGTIDNPYAYQKYSSNVEFKTTIPGVANPLSFVNGSNRAVVFPDTNEVYYNYTDYPKLGGMRVGINPNGAPNVIKLKGSEGGWDFPGAEVYGWGSNGYSNIIYIGKYTTLAGGSPLRVNIVEGAIEGFYESGGNSVDINQVYQLTEIQYLTGTGAYNSYNDPNNKKNNYDDWLINQGNYNLPYVVSSGRDGYDYLQNPEGDGMHQFVYEYPIVAYLECLKGSGNDGYIWGSYTKLVQ